MLDCARTKIAVVAVRRARRRRAPTLNLGHTIGHAIETVTAYRRYRHGEAVALGLLAALRLGGTDELRAQVLELLAGAGLPTTLDAGVDPEAVVAATRLDKKRVGNRVPFVLVRSPGDVVFGQRVAAEDVLAAVRELASGLTFRWSRARALSRSRSCALASANSSFEGVEFVSGGGVSAGAGGGCGGSGAERPYAGRFRTRPLTAGGRDLRTRAPDRTPTRSAN